MHGGVVSEPVYWRSGAVVSCAVSEVKSSGPVSVTVPGVAISARFLVTLVMRSVVLPLVVSWKRALRTATRLELSGVLVSCELFFYYFYFLTFGFGDGGTDRLLRVPCAFLVGSTPRRSYVRMACGNGIASRRNWFHRK